MDPNPDTYNWINNLKLMIGVGQYIDRCGTRDAELYRMVFNELVDNRVEYHQYFKKLQLNDMTIRRYYEDRIYVGKKLEFAYDLSENGELAMIRKNTAYNMIRIPIVDGQVLDTRDRHITAFALDGYESMMTVIKTRVQKFIQDSRIVDDFFKKIYQIKHRIPDQEKVVIKSILTSLFYSAKMKLIDLNLHMIDRLMDDNDKLILMMDISTYFFNEYFTHYKMGSDIINIDMVITVYEDEWKILRINSIERPIDLPISGIGRMNN